MATDRFSLTNKKILITGASSGIGRAIAEQSASSHASVILCGRNAERLEQTRQALMGESDHQFILADLEKENDIIHLASKLPQLDGVVLNAGAVKIAPLRFLKMNDVQELFQVNVFSSMMLIQQLLKNKKLKDGASVCFISSVASQYVTLGNSVYSATKGAVNSFTKSVALELAPKNIRVNAILPGFIETSLMADQSVSTEQLELHKKNYPLGRFGKPNDVAFLAIYLLSDAASWMTGSLLTLDGGYSLR